MKPLFLSAVACMVIFAYAARAFSAEEGSLTVTTDPDGIEVWLDDKYVGDTPVMEKKLKAGRYTVKLIDPIQHTSISEEVLIQEGRKTVIEKAMKGKFGSLKVTSDPEAANVYLLTSLGKTPVSNDFMNPGKYRLEIRHPNKRYSVASEDIVIPRGELVNVTKALEKQSPFDLKAFLRLGFGAGAIAGFVWAIVEQGNKKAYDTKADEGVNAELQNDPDRAIKKGYEDNAHSSAVKRTFGVVIGCVCVVGFEIVAFF
jgi:hypothetical protein